MTTYVWHFHHTGFLVEPLIGTDSLDGRIADINAYKPANERPTRLRLLKKVVGVLPLAVQKADADWLKAEADWRNAYADLRNAEAAAQKAEVAVQKADADFWKARAAVQKADADFWKARAALQKAKADWWKAYADNLPAIEALHAVECPDCPWDGQTIFPKGGAS